MSKGLKNDRSLEKFKGTVCQFYKKLIMSFSSLTKNLMVKICVKDKILKKKYRFLDEKQSYETFYRSVILYLEL